MNHKHGASRNVRAAVAAAVICACVGGNAHAAWLVDANAKVDSQYDDNVRLSTDGEDSAIATTTGGELHVRNVTESSEVEGIAGAKYLTYSGYNGPDQLDNEDIEYGEIHARVRAERLQWGLNGAVRRDVLLRTVGTILEPIGVPGTTGTPPPVQGTDGVPIGDGIGSDAGSVQEQVRRTRTEVSPFASYQLSQKSSLRLGYSYLGLDYDKETATGLDDSTTQAVTLDLMNRVTQRDVARIGFGAARFDPDNNPDSTDAYQFSAGWDRDFSDRVRAGFDVGGQWSERAGDTNTGYLLRLRASRTTDAGVLRARFAHSLQPAGYGDLVESDTLDLTYRVNLSSRLDLNVDGRGYRTRQSSNQSSNDNNERDYVEIGPELTYALFESLRVGGYYHYRWVDRQSEGSATSNAIGLTLTYQPKRQF
jgi:hypothetical protein